jgi:nitrate reductase beta subunit
MSNQNSDGLIRLIQSLSKSEKRSFKLYATRNSSSSDDLKFLQLFDFIEKTENYSDDLAIQKLTQIKKSQLSNIKAHLYKQILTSLRLQYLSRRTDSEIRESIDCAQICIRKAFISKP